MKCHVRTFELCRRVCFLVFLQRKVHPAQHRRRRPRDGGSERDRFEQTTHGEDLVDLLGFELSHQQPAIRQALDPAFRDQQRQRLADRLPADAELVRQLLLADGAAGAQRAAFDRALDPFHDRLGEHGGEYGLLDPIIQIALRVAGLTSAGPAGTAAAAAP